MPAARQLFILRHAKSSWDDPALPDHDRPLAPRGIRATALLAVYVREHGIAPELVICSTARRARETLEGVAPPGEVVIDPALYGADTDDLELRLRQVKPEIGSVMIVGHNPTLQMLVLRLAGADGHAAVKGNLAEVRRKFPTGALATLSFDDVWSELAPGRCRLTGFVRPRDLD
jgi:phosphohistidine phosphatase